MYFDEQAAIDSLEIIEGGNSIATINSTLEKGNMLGVEGGAGKNFMSLFSFGLKGNAHREKNTLIQNQITSTLVSKFIDSVVDDSLELLVIEKPKLKIQTNSNAYYRNLLPITQMIKDFSALKLDSQTEMTVNAIDFDQLGAALDSLSAYYEMEGEYKGKPAIYRFNIDGLRNNYTLVDLIKVTKIKLFGIIVGDSNTIDLSFDKRIDDLVDEQNDEVINPDFEELVNIDNFENKMNEANSYHIIDVILAGIE
ncbi:hypothetical protein PL111_1014 [Leuconostoc inhae]|uniref:Uncharacterized protein n=1 Tax=Leuconostoc inhae TaxID=178001 RepID=A0AAN2QXE3_9LACO|nr:MULTISPECIES: DUF6414 family protein [Leuconostoc]MBZ5982099.1 hypothetical protein [Leuconostoc gasicomitatum]MCT8383621.1 hypothetical protein [Leuconostoc mesenteroides]CUW12919.1 hypothetical protein KSL4_1790 [Leuconostoc inhae]CUW19102.1 hypothetical protein PL111_1014 [Leuconostoc inhae]